MNLFKKKRLLIFAGTLCAAWLGVMLYPYIRLLFMNQEERRTYENIKKFEKEQACLADSTLSKEARYEWAMRHFWEEEIARLWRGDEVLAIVAAEQLVDLKPEDFRFTAYQKTCGLLDDGKTLTSNQCLPWVIKTYNSLAKFDQQRLLLNQKADILNFEDMMRRGFGAQPYHPVQQQPLYTGKHTRQDTDFLIFQQAVNDTFFYLPDCCKLLSGRELEQAIGKDKFAAYTKGISAGKAYGYDYVKIDYYYHYVFLEDSNDALRWLRYIKPYNDSNTDNYGRRLVTKYFLLPACIP